MTLEGEDQGLAVFLLEGLESVLDLLTQLVSREPALGIGPEGQGLGGILNVERVFSSALDGAELVDQDGERHALQVGPGDLVVPLATLVDLTPDADLRNLNGFGAGVVIPVGAHLVQDRRQLVLQPAVEAMPNSAFLLHALRVVRHNKTIDPSRQSALILGARFALIRLRMMHHRPRNALTDLHSSILGVDLDGTTLHLGKVRGDHLVTRFFHSISSGADSSDVLNQIIDAIEQAIDETVVGIGFGAPSIVDTDKGIVFSVQNIPSWQEVHLKQILEMRFGLPVYVNNDANAFAAGELYFGHGREYRNLVGMKIGAGLGVGLVFEGRLCPGGHCGAGEIGRLPYEGSELEDYCSSKFFQRRSRTQEILLRSWAEHGDPNAKKLYDEFGEHLGYLMQVVLYAYDPEVVILGGDLCGAFPLFEERMMEHMESFAYKSSLAKFKVLPTRNEVDGAVLGAAALYLDSLQNQVPR